MKNATIDNSTDFGLAVLWQYDKATALLTLASELFGDVVNDGTDSNGLMELSTEKFWDDYIGRLDISTEPDDTAKTVYRLNLLGFILGVPRPRWDDSGTAMALSNYRYRLLLLAKASIMDTFYSATDIAAYMTTAFEGNYTFADSGSTITWTLTNGKFVANDSTKMMAIAYGKKTGISDTELISLYSAMFPATATDESEALKRLVLPYPAGVDSNKTVTVGVLGLNTDATTGQNLENFDNGAYGVNS